MQSIRKILSYCLFPLTIWYAVGVRIRGILFDWGILKEESAPVATIGVGNLATGGTGKTPHTEYLLRLLHNNYTTAFLSRGYRRKSKGFHLASEPSSLTPAELLGDEPSMVASKFPDVISSVCEKRMEGIQNLMQLEKKPQVIVLDDVYQHRYVKPSVNILLSEYERPFYDDRILPFGNLRESRRESRRADLIVITKCPHDLSYEKQNEIRHKIHPLPHQRVYFSYLDYGLPVALEGSSPLSPEASHILLFTGIVHPQPLKKHLEKDHEVTLFQFPDHHDFTREEIQNLIHTFHQIPSSRKIILTTEKDAARLRSTPEFRLFDGLPIGYVPIEVRFLNSSHDFDQTIINHI